MKPVVVFLLLVLGCSLTEGLVFSKCELSEQLMKAVDGLSQMAKEKGMSGENFVAKLVCYANLASGFSTSVVKKPIPRKENHNSPQQNGHNREGRSISGLPPPTTATRTTTSTRPTKSTRPTTSTRTTTSTRPTESTQPTKSTRPTTSTRTTTSTRPTESTWTTKSTWPIRPITLPAEFNQFTTTSSRPTQSTRSTVANTQQQNTRPPIRDRRSPHDDDKFWTYFGIFQLSNGVACTNGTISSPNICETDCSSFVDDDISDDISCLLKLIVSLLENPSGKPYQEELKRMIKLIFQWECRDKHASDYFAECP